MICIHDIKMRWRECFKQELAPKNFGLEHDQPHLFVRSQCGSKSFYIIWTMFAALYHATWIVIEPMLKVVSPYYFIFLTNQGYMLLTFTCICHCAATMYVHCWRQDILDGNCKFMPWYLKAVWIMTNVSNIMALVITISFYILIQKDMSSPFSIEKHALNTLFVIVNTSITAMPVRIYHVYQPIGVGTIYVIFSIIYQYCGGGVIYKTLDWNNTQNTMIKVILIILLVVPILHLAVYGLHVLRTFVASKFCHKIQDYTLRLKEEKIPRLPDLYIRHTS